MAQSQKFITREYSQAWDRKQAITRLYRYAIITTEQADMGKRFTQGKRPGKRGSEQKKNCLTK